LPHLFTIVYLYTLHRATNLLLHSPHILVYHLAFLYSSLGTFFSLFFSLYPANASNSAFLAHAKPTPGEDACEVVVRMQHLRSSVLLPAIFGILLIRAYVLTGRPLWQAISSILLVVWMFFGNMSAMMILELDYNSKAKNVCPGAKLPFVWFLVNDMIMVYAGTFVATVMMLHIYSAAKRVLSTISILKIRQFVSMLHYELHQDGAIYFFAVAGMQLSLWFINRWIPDDGMFGYVKQPIVETGLHSISCALSVKHLGIVHMELEHYSRLVSNLRRCEENIVNEEVVEESADEEK